MKSAYVAFRITSREKRLLHVAQEQAAVMVKVVVVKSTTCV